MNTAFEKLHTYLKQKEIDLFAYQDYLQTITFNYESISKALTQRSVSLREFYDYLSLRSPEVDPKTPSATTAFPDSELLGKSLGGYQLLEILGEGGMGIVYKAYHPGLKQIVAIKLIRPESQSSTNTIQRFLREMQIMAKLDHPGIVKILNSGEEEGRFYLIMEYVQGSSLEKKRTQLSLHEKIEILMMVLEALSYAHQKKIIHRDLKLENILVAETGHPKIVDFGLAKEQNEERNSLKLTRSGILLGTAIYMAPEQIRGESDCVSERTDLYAIGICLYKLLSGRYPFEGKTLPELAKKIEHDEVPLLSPHAPNIHRDLDAILLKALEKHPEKRYSSAEIFANDLRCFLSGHPVTASFPSWPEYFKKWSLRHRTLLSTVLSLFILFSSFLWITLKIQNREKMQQFEEKYSCAQKEYEPVEANSASFEAKKQLFHALHLVNMALQEKQDPKAESLKWNIGEKLLQVAYQTKSYLWATYLVQEMKHLSSVPLEKRNRLPQELQHEKEKESRKQLQQFERWQKKLYSGTLTKDEVSDAIYDIVKMSDPLILQNMAQELEKGIQYLLENEDIPDGPRFDYYCILLKIIKYWDKPELIPLIQNGFNRVSEKLGSLEEQKKSLKKTDYLVLFFKAMIPYAKKYKKITGLRELRWKLGSSSLFWKKTQSSYTQWLKTIENQSIEKFEKYPALAKGIFFLEKKEFEKALHFLNEALRENPQSLEAYHYRGMVRNELGDFKGAIADYTEILKLSPQSMEAYSNRGMVKSQLQDFDGAIADYTEILKRYPQESPIFFNRGNAKFQKQDLNGALEDFTEAIRLDPQYSLAYNSRGSTKEKLKDYTGALIDYNEVIRLHPEDASVYSNRGNIKKRMEQYEEAMADYNESIRLQPQDSKVYFNRGSLKTILKDLAGTLVDYNEAIRLNPHEAIYYGDRGKTKEQLKDFIGALADYNQAIFLNPQYFEIYYARGTLKIDLKDFKGALSDYQEAIRLNPQYFEVYNNRGNLRSSLGDFRGALSDYHQALQISESAEAYTNRGLARVSTGDLSGAMSDYNDAIRLNPHYINAYYSRSALKENLNDWNGAMSDYTLALEIDPQNPEIYANRGHAKARKKDFPGALEDYNQMIRLNPNDANAYQIRGDAKSHLGEFKGAITDYSMALQLNPQNAFIYLNRGVLYSKYKKIQEAKSDFFQFLRLTQQNQDPQILMAREQILALFPEFRKK